MPGAQLRVNRGNKKVFGGGGFFLLGQASSAAVSSTGGCDRRGSLAASGVSMPRASPAIGAPASPFRVLARSPRAEEASAAVRPHGLEIAVRVRLRQRRVAQPAKARARQDRPAARRAMRELRHLRSVPRAALQSRETPSAPGRNRLRAGSFRRWPGSPRYASPHRRSAR